MTEYEKARDFVAAWTHSQSVKEVATAINRSTATVSAYAKKLRKLGVNLPNHSRRYGLSSLEVAQLNSFIKKARKEA